MTIDLTTDFTVNEGETYSSSDGSPLFTYYWQAPDHPTLTLNLGEIISTSSGSAKAFYSWNGFGLIDNRGLLKVTAGLYATGLHVESWGPNVVNSGTWWVEAGIAQTTYGGAHGIWSTSPDQTVTNNGLWHVQSHNGDAFGMQFSNNASVVNNGDMEIIAQNGIAYGIYNPSFFAATIVNNGNMVLSGTWDRQSIAIMIDGSDSPPWGAPNIVNTGTITAKWAIVDFHSGYSPVPSHREWVLNTGTINGNIDLDTGTDILENRNTINGDVDMGSGGYDVVDNTLGVINGIVWEVHEFRGGPSAEVVYGSGGDSTIIGAGGDDTLDGGGGNDLISGGEGADTLGGFLGDDTLNGGPGDDFIDGSEWIDTVTYVDAIGSVTVNLSVTGPQFVGGGQGTDILKNVENLTGSSFGDTLVGDSLANSFSGLSGGDTINGLDGSDVINGGDGNDLLFGGPGVDDMYGGAGNDNLYVVGSDNILDGGADYDQVIVLAAAGVNITIETGVEYVAGNSGNDVLSAAGTSTAIVIGGADGNDILTGGSGNDTLAGMNDTDEIHGGAGNDLLFAGTGSDNFFGEDGDDKIYILGNDATIDGGIGFDQAIILDTAGVSITLGSGIEYSAGNNGNDSIDGSALSTAMTLGGAVGDDTVRGGSANDIISGAGGIDILYGNGGNDQLFGGDGNDQLFGGRGNDNYTLGPGNDICFIEDNSDNDAVFGFTDGQDMFNFSLHPTVNDFGDLTIGASGSDALVTFNGGQLFIVGAAGLIDAGDFVFV